MITDNSLRVTIHLQNKTTKEFSESVCNGSGDSVDIKLLSEKLLSMQSKVNTFLTELVEQERETTQQTNIEVNSKLDDDDEDDDEEGDDDEDINEPPLKQQKT